jgi:hypothetical protein
MRIDDFLASVFEADITSNQVDFAAALAFDHLLRV